MIDILYLCCVQERTTNNNDSRGSVTSFDILGFWEFDKHSRRWVEYLKPS